MPNTRQFRQSWKFEKMVGRDPDTRVAKYESQLFDVTLEIDLDALFRHLGKKASTNRSGRSKIQDGMITATARRTWSTGPDQHSRLASHYQPDPQDFARQLHLERAELIDRLSKARELLAYTRGYLSGQIVADKIGQPEDWAHPAQSKLEEINKFLDAGLFGNRGGER